MSGGNKEEQDGGRCEIEDVSKEQAGPHLQLIPLWESNQAMWGNSVG